MSNYLEVVLTAGWIGVVALALVSAFGVAGMLYERYWLGNVNAFKPERRLIPRDRRVRNGA